MLHDFVRDGRLKCISLRKYVFPEEIIRQSELDEAKARKRKPGFHFDGKQIVRKSINT